MEKRRRGRKNLLFESRKRTFLIFNVRRVNLFVLIFYSLSLFQLGQIVPAKAFEKRSPGKLGGNFRYQETDISILTPGFSLSVIRSYNSQFQSQGLFGYGWHCEYDVRLFPRPGKRDIFLIEADGQVLLFKYDPGKNVYFSRQVG